ncbi:ATP-binding cassette domain-containing protein [Asticcacaulis sp. DW145]|uniref:ATP-binding cassette domain-containing protein n=1 Tax=Asticcacaulis currens TaxID=2984210 RepID=A0ABT5IHF2_9CAUL|nr:ATP-binding cassette domain-containing protein [Asticcacaulis currens]BEV11823.1 ATP-binding cassette domain-containing protein [Asticcacaulis sp. DW145]
MVTASAHDDLFEPDHSQVVVFRDVGVGYEGAGHTGHDPEHYILKDLNFTLSSGSFHFLTGPSGAGKTSLLRLIYQAQKPSVGEISLFGERLNPSDRKQTAEMRRRIGIVFQDFRLLEHLDVFDNAALPLFVRGEDPRRFEADVIELLTWVGLKTRLHAMPDVLSGGEKQRLAIARAVINRPTLILADEPTGNIDHAMGLRIMRLFIELNRLGATVLIATHDEALIRASGMPVLELRDGRLFRRDLTQTVRGAT